MALGKAVEAHDCAQVISAGTALLDARDVATLPGRVASDAFDIVVACPTDRNQLDRALVLATRGTALEDASDDLWHSRFELAALLERDADAVASLEAMARGRGGALNGVEPIVLSQFEARLERVDAVALHRRLLAVVTAPSFTPDDIDVEGDAFRRSYATILADAGDLDAAKPLVAAIDDPEVLIDLSLDRRLAAFGTPVDIRAAFDRRLAADRLLIVSHPRLLAPLLRAARGLRRLGRPAEAATMLLTVADRIATPDAFDDAQKANWWWDGLGRAYAGLGRYDDAIRALRQGAALSEYGQLNGSQVVSLARVQNRFGHGADALTTLAVFADPKRPLSAYGTMRLRLARGCAAALAGEADVLAADLAFVRAHAADAPAVVTDLLICANDLDGAAASLVARLADPKRQLAARVELSRYDPDLGPADRIAARWQAVAARSEVVAAAARAGGVGTFPIQSPRL